MKGPHTHFVITFHNVVTTNRVVENAPLKLRGNSKAVPGTFRFMRDVANVRHALPWKSQLTIEWSQYDGTDNPPVAFGTFTHCNC